MSGTSMGMVPAFLWNLSIPLTIKAFLKTAYKYGVSVPQLSIGYCPKLGLLPLPKTANPKHMEDNAAVDFNISNEDMEVLKNMEQIKNYGEAGVFPVYSVK